VGAAPQGDPQTAETYADQKAIKAAGGIGTDKGNRGNQSHNQYGLAGHQGTRASRPPEAKQKPGNNEPDEIIKDLERMVEDL
jgi:hypothetical protein